VLNVVQAHLLMSSDLTLYSLPNISFNQDLQVDLDLGELDLTSQDEFILDEVDGELNKKVLAQKYRVVLVLGFLKHFNKLTSTCS